ncbi:MAG: hypothetical protein AAF202_07010 [Pseudomonadota bacterium]
MMTSSAALVVLAVLLTSCSNPIASKSQNQEKQTGNRSALPEDQNLTPLERCERADLSGLPNRIEGSSVSVKAIGSKTHVLCTVEFRKSDKIQKAIVKVVGGKAQLVFSTEPVSVGECGVETSFMEAESVDLLFAGKDSSEAPFSALLISSGRVLYGCVGAAEKKAAVLQLASLDELKISNPVPFDEYCKADRKGPTKCDSSDKELVDKGFFYEWEQDKCNDGNVCSQIRFAKVSILDSESREQRILKWSKNLEIFWSQSASGAQTESR